MKKLLILCAAIAITTDAMATEPLKLNKDNIDEVIRIIRSSYDEAKIRLMEHFNLSDVQAQAICDMRLIALQGLNREKLENEEKDRLHLPLTTPTVPCSPPFLLMYKFCPDFSLVYKTIETYSWSDSISAQSLNLSSVSRWNSTSSS